MRLAILMLLAASLPAAQTKLPTGKRTDAQIQETIRASYAKSKLSADRFTASVKNGVATLEGRTDVIQRKGWATRYARLAGASQVINNIQIGEVAKQKARVKMASIRIAGPSTPAPLPAAAAAIAPTPVPAQPRRAILKH